MPPIHIRLSIAVNDSRTRQRALHTWAVYIIETHALATPLFRRKSGSSNRLGESHVTLVRVSPAPLIRGKNQPGARDADDELRHANSPMCTFREHHHLHVPSAL